jgi:hypothetical protein
MLPSLRSRGRSSEGEARRSIGENHVSLLAHAAPPSSDMDAPPVCPKCRSKMLLSRIEPHADGVDRRWYECRGCEGSETILVNFR